jgi:hypothetical protein
MTFIETYGKEIVALLAPLITWALNTFLRAKAKLEFALPHQFTFLVQEPLIGPNGNQISTSQTVHTNSFIIRNSGRETATKVELVFNWKPMCLNLWPVRHFEEYQESDRRYVMIFDSLAPGEVLSCEVLSVNAELPNLITVRSAQCVAQNIFMYPQPIVSTKIRIIATVLMGLGLAAFVYLAILLIQFLVLKTPLGH